MLGSIGVSFIICILTAIGLGLPLLSGAQNSPEVPGLVVERVPPSLYTAFYPNELDNRLHYAVATKSRFAKPTAAIAVGTFRAFNLAAVLRRDLLVTYDVNPAVTEFNAILQAKILNDGRRTFLRDVLAVEDVHTVVDSRASFLKAAEACVNRHEGSFREGDRRHAFRRLMARYPLNSWPNWCRHLAQYAEDDASWAATFMGSDQSYEYLRSMIREGRVLNVTGDIAGPNLAAVGKFLHAKGYVVSELDLSNAIDYVYGYDDAAGMRALNANVGALPQEPDSRVLITESSMFLRDMKLGRSARALPFENGWAYLEYRFGEWKKIGIRDTIEEMNQALVKGYLRFRCDRDLTGT